MGAGVYTLERKMGGCQRMAGRERVGERARKRYRVAEMHRIPQVAGLFLQKSY